MAVTDPISDFLTRIRNASKAKKIKVEIPSSKMKAGLSEILKKNGYIYDYKIDEDSKQNVITVLLKYTDGAPAINGLKRISKPGLRIYKKSDELPRVLNGLGTAVISTSKGLLTEKEARRQDTGGEVVCYIW
ncbi:MAG: 30S ribosomal protein S8 [Bacteroidetes bacterium]|nr:30S ribosomal protein S8 [Bacteroidota bacterium]MCH8033172.1 30S ribosomal protein S8 [Bacteroidota bacterium]